MGKTIGNKIEEEFEGKSVRDENGEVYKIKGITCTPKRFGGIRKVFYTAQYEDKEVRVMNLAEAYLREHELLD